MLANIEELKKLLEGKVEISGDDVRVQDEQAFKNVLRQLWENAVLNENVEVRDAARWIIIEAGQSLGIILASINDLYMARGRKEYSGISVPAMNVRGFTYDFSRAAFSSAIRKKASAIIFEIAKSEMGYTFQPPAEFTPGIMAGAIAEGYRGPLFVQGDHFQFNAKKFKADKDAEIKAIKSIIKEAIDAGYLNIDIDSSTLVDLSKPTIEEQQRDNSEMCALMTRYIREIEPHGVTVSVGGEIGEVGEKNSTVEELEAYMKLYTENLPEGMTGISKVSVQTGTAHGGVVMPDGSMADVKIDFDTLKSLSDAAMEKWGMGGAVQHGASTLPDDAFDKFPQQHTVEVHLATGFQNILLDSPDFPADIKEKMYAWMHENLGDERKADWTDEQFYAKLRKKVWGPYKKEVMSIPSEIRAKLRAQLEEKLDFLYDKLGASNSADLVNEKVKPVKVKYPKPAGL